MGLEKNGRSACAALRFPFFRSPPRAPGRLGAGSTGRPVIFYDSKSGSALPISTGITEPSPGREAWSEPPLGRRLQEVLGDSRCEASAQAEKRQMQDRLFSAIGALPADQQAVLVATELEGCRFRERVEEWDVPIGTLLARKHRAMRAPRSALSEGGKP